MFRLRLSPVSSLLLIAGAALLAAACQSQSTAPPPAGIKLLNAFIDHRTTLRKQVGALMFRAFIPPGSAAADRALSSWGPGIHSAKWRTGLPGYVTLSARELTIAPLAFYYPNLPPKKAYGYYFTFSLTRDSRLTYTVTPDSESQEIRQQPKQETKQGAMYSQSVRSAPASRQLELRWVALTPSGSEAPEGWYRLTVTGSSSSDNRPFVLSLRFYHKPALVE